jgi:hypothetical protein
MTICKPDIISKLKTSYIVGTEDTEKSLRKYDKNLSGSSVPLVPQW